MALRANPAGGYQCAESPPEVALNSVALQPVDSRVPDSWAAFGLERFAPAQFEPARLEPEQLVPNVARCALWCDARLVPQGAVQAAQVLWSGAASAEPPKPRVAANLLWRKRATTAESQRAVRLK